MAIWVSPSSDSCGRIRLDNYTLELSSNFYPFGSSFKLAELMQYRSPVGLGPSGNT
jgi:hypothetical protein